jgi:threonine dehydratase
VRKTPLLSRAYGAGLLKLENLQHTGAYKLRGASNALLAQLERGDRRSVLVASAGNHAAGVAWAARHCGMSAIAVVPEGTPESKIRCTRSFGAEVQIRGTTFDQSASIAPALARDLGRRYLHPFDDPDVIAGQGTVGLELLEERPDAVVVPIGGGGLASGLCIALEASGIPVYGAQVEGVDSMRRILSGRTEDFALTRTIADGLLVRRPGLLTRKICARHLSGIVTVSEDEVLAAMRSLAAEDRVVAEGAGAVSVAALPQIPGRRKVAVVTGGNVDLAFLGRLLEEPVQEAA